MGNRFRFFVSVVLAAALLGGTSVYAASEADTAVAYLSGQNVLRGDQNGDLNLDKSLTRAELAVLMWRLNGMDSGKDNAGITARMVDDAVARGELGFTDVPDWAKREVMYCKMRNIVNGYNATTYGSGDAVSARHVCTVALRYMIGNQEGTTWTYGTAIDKAITSDIAPDYTEDTPTIDRGDVAVIMYRIMRPDLIPRFVVDVRADTGSASASALPKGSDHSRQVSDVLFVDESTTVFTRELYNLIRETYLGYLDTSIGSNENEVSFEHLAYYGTSDIVKEQLPGWINLFGHSGARAASNKYNGKSVPYVSTYAPKAFGAGVELNAVAEKTKGEFIRSISGLSDMEKVTAINQYICDRMTYGGAAPDYLNAFFISSANGLCELYVKVANYLFHEAGFPIFAMPGGAHGKPSNHTVNYIYINGKWEFYDPTNSDTYGRLLFGEEGQKTLEFALESERFTKFVMEAVIPKSTD
jgi:hypothetical protein